MVIGRLRNQAARHLTDACKIEQQTMVADEFGSARAVLRLVSASAACRVIKVGTSTSTSGSALTSGQDTMAELYRLAMLPDQEIDIDYQVTIGADVYQVVRLETALTDGFFRHAIISRKRGAGA